MSIHRNNRNTRSIHRQGHPPRAGLALLAGLMLAGASGSAAAVYSDLWGQNGEKWTSDSRLPEVGFAGYMWGEKPIPTYEVKTNVKDFGAKGDGTTDDTKAFNDAIAGTSNGAILIPNGTYKITNLITINKSNVVLRGESEDKTILNIPISLTDVKPNWGSTTTGKATSNYSWGGGFLTFSGGSRSSNLGTVTAAAKRGDSWIKVSSVSGISAGQWVQVSVKDDGSMSFTKYLYDGAHGTTGDISGLRSTSSSLPSRVKSVDAAGSRIELERRLPWEIRMEWAPSLATWEATVTQSGMENFTIKFPPVPWTGEFTEVGYNGIQMNGVSHCWVSHITLINAESGLFTGGGASFNTITDLTLTSTPDKVPFSGNKYNTTKGAIGHHGISLNTPDNLITRFDFQANYVHDISVQGTAASRNVFSNGKGLDVCFDHHKERPYSNVYTNIDMGDGSRLSRSGGGAGLGLNTASWGTWWSMKTVKDLSIPTTATFGTEPFGPATLNYVGVKSGQPTTKDLNGKWWEVLSPTDLVPQNIHEAQLALRLKNSPIPIKGRNASAPTALASQKASKAAIYSISGEMIPTEQQCSGVYLRVDKFKQATKTMSGK